MRKFDKDLFIECGKTLASGIVALLLLFFACVMCGCTKTQYIPEYHTESFKTDSTTFLSLLQTLRQIEKSRQSTSDTIIINHYERAKVNENGDTIGYESNTNTYKSTSRERELERTIEMLRDSVRDLKAQTTIAKVDSIRVPYPVERVKEVEKSFAWWQKGLMILGVLFLVGWGYAVYKMIRK